MAHHTPRSIAKDLSVSRDTVNKWITSGELRAMDLGANGRRKWHIKDEDLQAFLASRSNQDAKAKEEDEH